ncbi:MAG TPA: type VI secretion system baseplate subunit TssK [Gemmatimonadaceae bacterium]|nr:type VI secretion system baseplate subunit TssK [Gemmatimonadaceae bacterium]
MRQMQPVLWTKGLVLSPQHLQIQDRYYEDLIDFRLNMLTFSPWGFQRLAIDREALASGMFAITEAAGTFPDGLPFDVPGADSAPPPKALEGMWEQDRDSLIASLAVPEYQRGGHNVSVGSTGTTDEFTSFTRFRPDVVMRRDENTGLAEKPIQVARKNLRFLLEGESTEGSIAMPVARLHRSSTGEISLDPSFIPPLLDVGASEPLSIIVARLVEILGAKSTTLSGSRRQKNQTLAEFSISDVANFWLLYTINTHFPPLRHIQEVRRGHPGELYSAMLALAGALTTFSGSIHPRDLPTYSHEDLTTCFTKLDVMLRELLETVVPAKFVSLPMKRVRASVYAAALDREQYIQAPQFYLAVKAGASQADIIRRVPQVVKVASAERIDLLVRQALTGLPLTHTPSPPAAIAIKVNAQYFQITKGGAEWDAVIKARNIAVAVPADLPDPELELVLVLPPSGGG